MDPSEITKLLLALFFILLNAWFVIAEFALVKVRSTRLRELAAEGRKSAQLALHMQARLDEYLSAIQIGVTLASLALGWLGEPAVASLLSPLFAHLPGGVALTHGLAVTIAFLSIMFLHITFGEQAPKLMAIQSAERFALAVARPLRAFYVLTYPLNALLQRASNRVVRLFGFKRASELEEAHTEEELRMIVAASHRHGVLDEATRTLLDNVFEYSERVVREVMTPRRDVVTLSVRTPVQESLDIAIESEYTRFPLVDVTPDRVLGFIHVKDLMAVATGRRRITTLRDIARQPVYVPEAVAIDRVRRQFQARRTHFGVVVDEFGEFTGIVTLEDLLEELVGEIQDELDEEEPQIRRLQDGAFDVDGGLLLETAEKRLGVGFPEEIDGIDTVGGYVFTQLGRAPQKGDRIVVGAHALEVVEVDELRIKRLKVTRIPSSAARPLAAQKAGGR